MGEFTNISWCDHTFNLWWGCTKISPACDRCYAESTSNRYGFKIWGQDADRRFFGDKHWNEPERWNTAAIKAGRTGERVFCGSMCDVMEDRDDLHPHRQRLYELIRRTPRLNWLLLTKRPENFRRFLPADFEANYNNVWGMTTVESQDYIWRAQALEDTPFAVHGLSVEPMLGPVSIAGLEMIDWVIVGTESGSGARPMQDEWVRNLRDECRELGVAFFVKQMFVGGKLTKDVTKFPAEFQIQEFPR